MTTLKDGALWRVDAENGKRVRTSEKRCACWPSLLNAFLVARRYERRMLGLSGGAALQWLGRADRPAQLLVRSNGRSRKITLFAATGWLPAPKAARLEFVQSVDSVASPALRRTSVGHLPGSELVGLEYGAVSIAL